MFVCTTLSAAVERTMEMKFGLLKYNAIERNAPLLEPMVLDIQYRLCNRKTFLLYKPPEESTSHHVRTM